MKSTQTPTPNAALDTMAVIGWLVFDGDEWETVTLTEAGQAALDQAQREDEEIGDPFAGEE